MMGFFKKKMFLGGKLALKNANFHQDKTNQKQIWYGSDWSVWECKWGVYFDPVLFESQ